MNPLARLVALARPLVDVADTWLRPLVLLWLRIVVGLVFLRSGLTKLDDWETTVFLFTEEYHVPLLPPPVAAFLGTAGETLLSPLLIAGLAGRFAAAGLFVVNAMAVISYPGLTETTREFHLYWAMLLAVIAAVGPGTLSLDAWLTRKARD
ncbi:DoxX family protein [Crenobacter cavernae]|uniref:DoxX family protein n=1 Tax=Crenobacter cavernae TaxID=2290923 RepID=A0A345Y6N2_9NEIS|nr:DoxX family protein [Crenobacter cavernae]AXK39584.1 DoxX family protein [Crenobacter cavernae]RXZ45036.1 DoxX family protein [Crenobacter cavernae]